MNPNLGAAASRQLVSRVWALDTLRDVDEIAVAMGGR